MERSKSDAFQLPRLYCIAASNSGATGPWPSQKSYRSWSLSGRRLPEKSAECWVERLWGKAARSRSLLGHETALCTLKNSITPRVASGATRQRVSMPQVQVAQSWQQACIKTGVRHPHEFANGDAPQWKFWPGQPPQFSLPAEVRQKQEVAVFVGLQQTACLGHWGRICASRRALKSVKTTVPEGRSQP